MKKIVVALFIVMVLILLIKNETEVLIPTESIRFRIIASSNDLKDQETKLEIKDELEPVLTDILSKSSSLEESRNSIKNNMYNIKNIVNNFDIPYKVDFGQNYFPEKTYKGVTYKEGEYESLVITLGDGLGDNWWCVLFPPLCLLEASSEDYDDITYTSFIKELIEKY